MKHIILGSILSIFFTFCTAQDLSYYLPQNISYNKNIPTPKDIINHDVGEWHITHDRLLLYMKAVAKACPEKVQLQSMGFTAEQREQVLLIISSPNNIKNLEQLRQQHVQLQSGSNAVNVKTMPVVVWIGHSIHGNESSGSNAALLGAYYLAAAQGSHIDSILENTIILYDPSFNPDGLQRFSTWANQHKSKNLVTDPNSREFNEVWPGGRFNHYWFDLNRDWLPQVHIESQNRVRFFHQWKPNILTDHHEMGSNASFFFQPGVPSRVNPLTPKINQDLTAKIASFHTAALDKIKSLYFTKENYDDFYYGKGSTYPDAQGCIGILFEQASSRGHAQQTANGILRFPFTIRNQFTTELSTLDAALHLKQELLQYQKDFFSNITSNKTYIYGDAMDITKTKLFTEMLLRNDIDVYTLKGNKDSFDKQYCYAVPLQQKQQVLIKAIFEKTLSYKDSIFYDITAWTFPLAYNLAYQLSENIPMDKKISIEDLSAYQKTPEKTDYAYIMHWNEYQTPAALYALQKMGVQAKVANKPFSSKVNNIVTQFNVGSILLTLANQKLEASVIWEAVKKVSNQYQVSIQAINTGLSVEGVDLGSAAFGNIITPSIALLVGTTINATDAGEVWHLLDQRMDMPVTQLEITTFNKVEVDKYNTIVLVGGTYAELNKDKLKAWVQNGGTLICMEEAVEWTAEAGLTNIKFKKLKQATDSTQRLAYNQRENINGAQAMSGAIFEAEIDRTHPLAYGYTSNTISTFKANKVFMEKSKNPFATPFFYKQNPLQSGWVSTQNKEAMNNTAAVIVSTIGSGKVISIDHNPNFRGFWLGGTKLFMNAIFFGPNIDVSSARAY
jgi:Zinc carboxypeptidase